MKPKFTAEELNTALAIFEESIFSGDSVGVARTKSCGAAGSPLAIKMMRTPMYVDILNAYMKKIGKNMVYRLERGKLTCIQSKSFTPSDAEARLFVKR